MKIMKTMLDLLFCSVYVWFLWRRLSKCLWLCPRNALWSCDWCMQMSSWFHRREMWQK